MAVDEDHSCVVEPKNDPIARRFKNDACAWLIIGSIVLFFAGVWLGESWPSGCISLLVLSVLLFIIAYRILEITPTEAERRAAREEVEAERADARRAARDRAMSYQPRLCRACGKEGVGGFISDKGLCYPCAMQDYELRKPAIKPDTKAKSITKDVIAGSAGFVGLSAFYIAANLVRSAFGLRPMPVVTQGMVNRTVDGIRKSLDGKPLETVCKKCGKPASVVSDKGFCYTCHLKDSRPAHADVAVDWHCKGCGKESHYLSDERGFCFACERKYFS